MKDSLGDRMKGYYEDRSRYTLLRRTYTIIRIDGKAFHTYTRGLKKPFDEGLIDDMNQTAAYLCKNIQGAKLAYVQSDEISVLITDFDDLQTDMWFDGNVQKMTSVAASLATARFNQLRWKRDLKILEDIRKPDEYFINIDDMKLASFDARVFQIPFAGEVANYFLWRQQDATRNSISSVAQSLYSHKELEKKSSNEKQEMIFQKGINWDSYSFREKRGGVIARVEIETPVKFNYQSQEPGDCNKTSTVIRKRWELVETPIFSQDKEFLDSLIPSGLLESVDQ